MKNKNYFCCDCKTKLKSKRQKNSLNYFCEQCELTFPTTLSGIACLFSEPELKITQAYKQCYQSIQYWQKRGFTLSEVLKKSKRKEALLPLIRTYNENQNLFKNWATEIEDLVKKQHLAEAKSKQHKHEYGYDLNYLRHDWGHHQTPNSKKKPINISLERSMRLVSKRGRAAALGVGAGRFGLELGDYFDDVVGIDSSYAQVIQYYSLLKNEINVWHSETRNQISTKNFANKTTCKIPNELKCNAEKFQFLWGNAFNFPCPDHYFDWVFSVYFSDIRPLPELLDETLRILKPGGFFLHIGPLEYHFPDIEHHYSFEEFKQNFLANGFTLIHESLTQSNLESTNNSLKNPARYQDKVLLLKRQ